MSEHTDSPPDSDRESKQGPENTLSPEQLEHMLRTVDSMMTEDYYVDEEGTPLRRSLFIDIPDKKNESYFLIQYKDSPDLALSLAYPSTEDAYIDVSNEGGLSTDDGEGEIPTDRPLVELTLSLLADIKQAYEINRANKEEELRLAEQLDPANFSEPEQITEAEAIRVFNEAAYPDGHNGNVLSAEFIRTTGIALKEKIQMTDNLTMHFCIPYTAGGRMYALAFAEYMGEITPRTYYQSHSQGVWRYLPGQKLNHNEQMRFGKGLAEFSLDLPHEAQSVLNSIAEQGILEVDRETADRLREGTLTSNSRRHETHHLTGINPLEKEMTGTGIATPAMVHKNALPGSAKRPEDLVFSDEMAEKYPDFSVVQDAGKTYSPQYGAIHMHEVTSLDGEWRYVFSENSDGQVWLSHAEDITAPINTVGLRKSYPQLGVLYTPPHEYKSQAGDFASREIPGTDYVDVYDKFVSRLPIIQDCIRALANSGKNPTR